VHRVDSPGKESLSLLGEVEGLDALEREDGLGGDGRKRGEEHRDTHFFFSAVLLHLLKWFVCCIFSKSSSRGKHHRSEFTVAAFQIYISWYLPQLTFELVPDPHRWYLLERGLLDRLQDHSLGIQ